MARSRNIKPSLFKNELLGVADPMLTVLFAGLWCLADREGYLEDRPLRIKGELFPYRDSLDINGYLTELERLGFIRRFQAPLGLPLIHITKFLTHQNPHKTERPSDFIELDVIDSCPLPVKYTLNNVEIPEPARLIPDSLNLIPFIKKTSLRSEKNATAKPGKPKKPSRTAGLLAVKFSDRAVDLATVIIDEITPKADPEKDMDGKHRPIRTDMALLVQRLEEIMNSDPAWTEDVLICAYQDYLKGRTKNIKAPQYFFSTVPDKYSTTDEPVWKPYGKGVLYKNSRQRPLPPSEGTQPPLCQPITVSDEPSPGSAQPRGQDEHD